METQVQGAGRILVVDDEPAVGRVLEQWLTRRGYDVRYAPGFVQARELVESEPFDLVTLDIVMPGVDGLGVLRWLRAEHPDIGVIMATALTNLDSVLEAMRLGAINYVLKPFNLNLITAEVERAMERQRLVAENRSYQRELERKVEVRTHELAQAYERLREANGQLQRQVRELQARDRLAQFQMALHTVEEACVEVTAALAQAVGAAHVALYRPAADGSLGLVCCAPVLAGDPGPEALRLAAEALDCGAVAGAEQGGWAVPVLYREDGLATLWLRAADEGAVPAEEWIGTLGRLGRVAAVVLRCALVAEDLERAAL